MDTKTKLNPNFSSLYMTSQSRKVNRIHIFSKMRWKRTFSNQILIGIILLSSFIHPVLSQFAEAPPQAFTQQPQSGSPEVQGNTKVLLCQATGIPSAVYRWLKNGKFISPTNTTDTSLKIQNIQRSDAGEYQCLASNVHGAILSNRANIQVAYMIPFANTNFQEKTVDRGHARVIDLPPIESFPDPSIQWFEGTANSIPPTSLKYHVTLAHQLVILETSLEDDNKSFKATAVNSYTGQRSESQQFVLKVRDAGNGGNDIGPEIVIPPVHTTAIQYKDSNAVLECVANGKPISYITIAWYKKQDSGERKLINHDGGKYILSLYKRTLTIKNPMTTDSGIYECEASFTRTGGSPYPPVTATANLTVLEAPSFITSPPDTISKDYGLDVEIQLMTFGTPKPKIYWYKNAKPIKELEDDRYQVQENGNLLITSVNPTDAGMFQVFVNNSAGEANAATWLKVLSSPPSIIERPHNDSVIAGERARIPCKVTGAPKPDIQWYRVTNRGTEDLTGSAGRIEVIENALLIPVAEVEDTGRYVCNATNTKGNDYADAFLTVALRTTIIVPPQNASVIKGTTVPIQCGVSSDPLVQVTWTWYHKQVMVPRNDARRQIKADGTLEVKSVRNTDIGEFRCDVTSAAGNATAKAYISVIELPYAPSIVSATLNTQSTRAVDVKWEPGFNGNSAIQRFVVQYRLTVDGIGESWQIANDRIGKEQRMYTVSNLLPARSYQFVVSAVNEVGEGPSSPPSDVVQLPQQPPSGPPRGVVGSPRSESSIIIQWQPPSEDKWNGQLKGYMIKYKPTNYPDSTLNYENITNRMISTQELKGLIVFQEYEIAVAAYNSKGVGVYSSYIEVMTQEGIPSAPPRDIAVEATSSTAIKVTWLPPDPQYINGINQGYKIYAQEPGKPDSEIEIVVPSDTSNMLGQQTGLVEDLHKFTDYSISVLCFTSKGNGPRSQSFSVKTNEDVPDMVGSLVFENILDTSLQVIWTEPANINGILTGYTLSYQKKGQTITKVSEELEPDVLTFKVTGLESTTTYTIEVYAKTRVGPGPPNSADIESGRPPVIPEAPRNLAITNIKATSVLVQFIPGFNGYTSISKWIVEGQVGNKDTWELVYEESAPEATSIQVEELLPYTRYRLRIKAENVAGQSEPSEPTRFFETIQAPPSNPPREVTVRAVNETALRVRWTPLSPHEWNGENKGYKIQVNSDSPFDFSQTLTIDDENANSYTITKLEEWTEYKVQVAAFNSVGQSGFSPITTDKTRESVPSSGPVNITAQPLGSTSIKVRWSDVPLIHQNGQIEGFKIKYVPITSLYDEPLVMDVNSSETREVMLTGLRKYTRYNIEIVAYTRIGDGVPSTPPVTVRTDEDVPGPPSGIYFPFVTSTTAHVFWDEPAEPNGIITGYRVGYREKSSPPTYAVVDDELGPGTRDYQVENLQTAKYYVFTLDAKTQLGWGVAAEVEVFTMTDRTVCESPSTPKIGPSGIGARSITISWVPGSDHYAPVRNYTIQVQMTPFSKKKRQTTDFEDLPDYVPHDATSFTVSDLKPNTRYRLRIAANNDIGRSAWSPSSEQVTTKQAAPDMPPGNLQVVPKTTNSVLVSWQPPPLDSWNGGPLGYQVWHSQLQYVTDDNSYQHVTVTYPMTSVELTNLVSDIYYELKVNAFNSKGHGPFSRPLDIYVGEAVPTEPPEDFVAKNKSSTEIICTWKAPPAGSTNGELLGYKIHYWISGQHSTTQVKTVGSSEMQTVLSNLKMFTDYSLVILAFNAAGDGPNTTTPVKAKTDEGIPGPPSSLGFSVPSLTSLNVTWEPPLQSNGYIEMYEVSFYQDVEGEREHVKVTRNGDRRSYLAKDLNENVKYVFSVRAKTRVDWGPPKNGNITTGPQPGSPSKPSKPLGIEEEFSIKLKWQNGDEGDSPITEYIIQAREKKTVTWETVETIEDPKPEATISFLSLKPKTEYQFRVIAINSRGISAPSEPSEFLKTLEIENKPFYQQWWFLVIVALIGLIFVIIVISLLCLTGRQKKATYKDNTIPRTTIHLSEQGSTVGEEEGGFHTFEMRQSARRSKRKQKQQPMAAAAAANGLPPYSLRPPRPSPGSVNYSDDETKQYPPDDDSSSVTDKPSDCSDSGSTVSQVTPIVNHMAGVRSYGYGISNEGGATGPGPYSLDPPRNPYHSDPYRQDSYRSDYTASAKASDSEPEEKEPPPPFVNHYVNGDVRHSWKSRQKPANAYSYTDSERDSDYAVTLNGGHVIMNNMAGSRAPLPGFSSFV